MLPILKKLIKSSSRGPLVELGWIDAATIQEDEGEGHEVGELWSVISAGFLVRVDSEMAVLMQDFCPDDKKYRNSQSIPFGWIIYARLHDGTLLKGKRYAKYAHKFPHALQVESPGPSDARESKARGDKEVRSERVRPSDGLPGPTGAEVSATSEAPQKEAL